MRANTGVPTDLSSTPLRPEEVLADVFSLRRKVAAGVYAVITLDLPLYYFFGYTLFEIVTLAVVGWIIAGASIYLAFGQIIRLRKRSSYATLLMLNVADSGQSAEAGVRVLEVVRGLLKPDAAFLTMLDSADAHAVIATYGMSVDAAQGRLEVHASVVETATEVHYPLEVFSRVGDIQVMLVPVVALRRTIGLLYLAGVKRNRDLTDRPLLSAIGAAIGMSVDNLRQRELLQQKESRLRSVMKAAPVVVFAIDTAGITTFIQGRSIERLGLSPEQLLGRSVDDVYANYPQVLQSFRRAFAGEEVTSVAAIQTEAARVVFEYRLAPDRDEKGRVVGIIGVATDITERKQAEVALQESQRALETLVSNLPGFAYRSGYDRDGTMEYVSDGVEEVTGYPVREFIDGMQNFSSIIHPDDREGVWLSVQTAISKHTTFRLEYRIVSARGEERWLWEQGQAIYSEDGEVEALEGFINDITERKLAEQGLAENERFLSTLVGSLPGFVFRMRADGQFTLQYVSQGVVEITGYTPEEVRGWTMAEYLAHIHPEDQAVFVAAMQAGAHGSPFEAEFRVTTKDGSEKWLWKQGDAVKDESGKTIAVEAFVMDVTARKRSEEALTDSEERFRDLFENARDAVFSCDLRGRFLTTNNRLLEISGYSREGLQELTVADTIPTELHAFLGESMRQVFKGDPSPFELEILARDGSRVPIEVTARAVFENGRPVAVQGIARDISERRQAEETIRRLAYHDALTGLPNRALFEDRLNVALAQAKRTGEMVVVMFMDLDSFKVVNDTLGHAAGDRLLQSVASDLQRAVRDGDTVARVGGDEFTVLLPNIEKAEDATDVARRILEALQQPRFIDGQEFRTTGSIGITTYPEDGEDAGALLRNADTAMYRAKENGRDNYQLYTPAMNSRMLERLSFENDLRHALKRDEFRLFYQPIVNVESGEVTGAEALVRWEHPTRGLILPDEFISIAEESGLIVELGEWVLRRACNQIAEWRAAGMLLGRVSVNLSARQLQQEDIVGRIAAVLEETGVRPEMIELEITEGAVLKNVEYITAVLLQLRAMGLSVALDDFGTGYSSLTNLKQFPIDAVKIDRSFVRDLETDASDATIVSTVIAMAENLHLKAIAEGVETQAQLDFLRSRGCDEFQGYLVSRPVPADRFPALVVASEGRKARANGRGGATPARPGAASAT